MNRIIIIGHLGKDPEIRTPGDTPVCNFSVAVSERFKDRNGNLQEATEWFNVEAWGRTAEVAAKYLSKGKKVMIEGSIKTDKWQDKQTGETKYRQKVRCMNLEMLSPKSDGGQGGSQAHDDSDIPF